MYPPHITFKCTVCSRMKCTALSLSSVGHTHKSPMRSPGKPGMTDCQAKKQMPVLEKGCLEGLETFFDAPILTGGCFWGLPSQILVVILPGGLLGGLYLETSARLVAWLQFCLILRSPFKPGMTKWAEAGDDGLALWRKSLIGDEWPDVKIVFLFFTLSEVECNDNCICVT